MTPAWADTKQLTYEHRCEFTQKRHDSAIGPRRTRLNVVQCIMNRTAGPFSSSCGAGKRTSLLRPKYSLKTGWHLSLLFIAHFQVVWSRPDAFWHVSLPCWGWPWILYSFVFLHACLYDFSIIVIHWVFFRALRRESGALAVDCVES